MRSRQSLFNAVPILVLMAGLVAPVVAADKTLKITAINEHPALDAARKGIKDELAERGYEAGKNLSWEFQSAQGDVGTAGQIAKKFVGDNPDVIVAIATPDHEDGLGDRDVLTVVLEDSSRGHGDLIADA